jgi:predicted nucleotidyltransferase
MKKIDFEIAKEFTSRVREQLGEVSVIVYGSRAREDSELFSDMDICVIAEKMDRKTKEIVFTIAWETGFKKDVVIVPLIFEKNEWENSPISESPIHNNIQKEGIKI